MVPININNFLKKYFLETTLINDQCQSTQRFLQVKRLRKMKMLAYLSKNYEKNIVPKMNNYIKIVEIMPNCVFFSHFRMEKDCFLKILDEIKPKWIIYKFGRPRIPLDEALYVTLWFLSNKSCYRTISDRFNISLSTAHDVIKQICKILSLINKVQWPTAEEHKNIIKTFNSKKKLPNVCGSVDGTHFKIKMPKEDPRSFYNRKGFYSVLMQAICDSNYRFIDVFIGWPGRAHDACVWKNSPIGKALAEGNIILPDNSYLIGDSAYSLQSYLLTPFKEYGNLSAKQRKYNYCLSSLRVCIEQAFGILKSKFQILDCINVRDPTQIKYVIMACVVLHNFIIENHGSDIATFSSIDIEENLISSMENVQETSEGNIRRNEVVEKVWQMPN